MSELNSYTHILRLARSGSLERAWALMEQHRLLDSETDERALTLQARLVKDRAKRAEGAERARLFGESAALYAKAGAIDQGSYPLINAASLSLLAGQNAQSEKLAREVLAALDANPDEAETPYWLGATRAEALLLLGQEPEARAALRQAVEKQPAAWEDHAATIGQFAMLCEELGCDATWIEALRPPHSLHFAGIINVAQDDPAVQTQIEQWLERENVGFGYGALAAGSDIWIAETLLARGAELHVVLPCDLAAFRAQSVAALGKAWLPRFDSLIEQASEVECLDFASEPDAPAVTRAEAVACGMAMHNAQQLQSLSSALRIIGAEDRAPPPLCGRTSLIRATRLDRASHISLKSDIGHSVIAYGKDGMRTFASMEEAWDAVGTAHAAALDYLPSAQSVIPDAARTRLTAMFDSASFGQVHLTRAAAFALKVSNPETRIENMGDMRWAGGHTPFYVVHR